MKRVSRGESFSRDTDGGKFQVCSIIPPSYSRLLPRHVWTGISEYFNITWGIWLRYCLDGKADEVQLVWPSLFTSVPYVERKIAQKGGQSGTSKKGQ